MNGASFILALLGALLILSSSRYLRRDRHRGTPWFRPRRLSSVYEPRGVRLVQIGVGLMIVSTLLTLVAGD